ncbi:hypothetical protein ACEWY4_005412 [Coilia grayii]|uniref:Syncoilin n=1 Tax=Coilia grayii TaxID=363190 RepID=A0ABD1KID2_9TELE
MEPVETAMTQGVCQDQGPGEQMSSVGNEHEEDVLEEGILEGHVLEEDIHEEEAVEGDALHLGEASDSGDLVDSIVSNRVHVHITDSMHPQFVEMWDPFTVQMTTQVTSASPTAQASIPSIPEPSDLEPAQTSACVPMQTSVSPSEPITPQLPLQSPPPSSPVQSASTFTLIQAQTCVPVSKHNCGQMCAPPPPPAPTESVPPPAHATPEQMRCPASCPPMPYAQSHASLASSISVLCFAPLPAQTSPPLQWEVEKEVSAHFDGCLEEVSALERRRDTLVQELLELERPMVQAVQALQADLGQACGHLTRSQLQLLRLQEKVRQVKRKLLSATRHCIQSQVDLSALQYEVAQSVIAQEELQSEILDRLQEITQLREEHRKQMDSLRVKKRHRPRTTSDLSHCRRFSDDLSRYTRGNMKLLEDWYEPRVLALLRHRQSTDEALRMSRGLTEELRTRLTPLQEEVHRLALQRDCLEHRISLMEQEREESTTKYKESILCLEESMRELRTEVKIQRMANAELKQLKNSLILELRSYGYQHT